MAARARWSRVFVGVVAVGSLLAVDATAADASSTALTPATSRLAAPGAAAAAKPKKVSEAPDLVSARVAARAQGLRVEAVSERTESATTFVNPDGTLTTEASAARVRFRDKRNGNAWRNIDLSLREVAGQVAPSSSDLGVSLSAGGAAGSSFVTVDHDANTAPSGKGSPGSGRSVSWALGGKLAGARLPKPTLNGTTATYAGVAAGVDVRVQVRPSGFEQDFIVKDRAAADAVAASGGSFQIPLKTKGLTAKATASGGVDFVDGKGKRVSFIPAPYAWDAKVDPRSGEAPRVPVKLAVVQPNPGNATLTITPDAGWLADPARQFPIVVDPTYASLSLNTSWDLWVATNYPNTDTGTDPELKAGTFDGGTNVARSFLQFPRTAFKGYDIVTANLSLYETHSFSCTAKPLYVHSSQPANGATRWGNQPDIGAAWGSVSVAKGYSSSCAAGWINIPMTSLAQFWADYNSTVTTFWVAIKASETDSNGWKRFSSGNGSYPPKLVMTYNRKPNAAAAPDLGTTADGSNTYTTPGTGVVQRFTKDSTPKFHSSATDPDGNKVAVTFEVHNTTTSPSSATLVASCATALGASGASGVSCSPTTALAPDKTYYVRAAVHDDRDVWNGTWSPWTTFYTQWATPPTPKVACNQGYTSGKWTDTDPAGTVTCSITSAGAAGTFQAPGYLDITVDGVAQPRATITPTTDWNVVHKTYTFPVSSRGYHEIKVTGLSRSLVPSAQASFGFGWGSASLTTPTARTASSGTLKVTAGAPPKGSATAVKAKVQWRVAASGNELTGWTDASMGEVTVTPSGTAATTYTGTFDLNTATHEAAAAAGVDVPKRTPVRLDVQVCFTYSGGASSVQCTWSQSPVTVTRLPHAFGAGYPTADAGVGQVALYTGEVALDGTDVSVPGYSGDITLSRSHTSFAGDGTIANWPTDTVTGVFGPGWTANLEGSDAGLAGLQVRDNTRIDGSIAFLDGEGEPLVYASSAGTRAYPDASQGQSYKPATEDTLDAAIKLTKTGTGSGMRLTLTEEDGTATTWKPLGDPTNTAGVPWRPEKIVELGKTGTATTFADPNNDGRVDRIIAPQPEGFAGSCPSSGTLDKGCRAIDITYAATTTATTSTPGDYTGKVKSISAWLWNPDLTTPAMAQTTVASYAYDTSGRLAQVTDPRTGLGTTYTWDGASTRIASVKSTGLAATKLSYSTGNPAKLIQVTREAPTSGQPDVTIARYAYDVPTSGTGLPTLTGGGSAGTGAWYQAKAPVTGYAVFGQDYTGPVDGSGASWPGVDWSYADLSYVDDLGYTVNTAAYGAGAWQVTSTDYDTTSNVVRSLDASATAVATAKVATGTPLDPADVDAMSTQAVYNAEAKDANGAVVLPAGSRVVDTYGPARKAVLSDGTEASVRPHTHTEYDQGAPDGGINATSGQRYSLPTTVTVSAATTAGGGISTDIETVSTITSGYDRITPADAAEGDGWALGQATKTITATPSGNITSIARYDTLGRAIEARQPLSNGSDAGTTRIAYYTPGVQTGPDAAANAACGNRPEWAGLVCHTYPAAAPSSGPTLPDETATYSMWLQPATVTETSGTGVGAASRTTTTTYDTAERTVSSKVTASGLGGSTTRPGGYTKYRSDNGLVEYTGWLNTAGTDAETGGRSTTSYDLWGRATTVVGDAGTVAIAYDTAGWLASVIDAKGTVAYGYDGSGTGGVDGAGKLERRGLTTSLTVSRVGTGGTLSYTAAYDAEGRMTRQGLPGGLTQVTDYDQAGEPEGLSYLGQVTPVTASTDADGNPVYIPGTPLQNQPWISWGTANDVTGRVRLQATDTGAAFDNGAGVASIDDVTPWTADANGKASSYGREYRYDPAGRLTYARSADTGIDPATSLQVTTCTERAYMFDANGRRTDLATTSHTAADCSDTGTTSHLATTGWDTADRPTTGKGGTGSYVYDLFGRQTTIPAVDAPNAASTPGAGAITLGYYDDDLPRSITQTSTGGSTATTFTLDAAGRRSTQTSTTTGGANPGTTTTVRRYTDGGDNPAWVETTAPGAPSPSVTRFAESIGADLSATITDTGTDAGTTDLSLADPHGDVVTTVTIAKDQASTTPAVAINGWASYDEYGNAGTDPRADAAIDQVDGPVGYGWLGAKQRSTTGDTTGLTLMGVRLYNNQRGLFTSVDPVPGGNENAYTYPADPVNGIDLDGRINFARREPGGGVSGARGGGFSAAREFGSVRYYSKSLGQLKSKVNAAPRVNSIGFKNALGRVGEAVARARYGFKSLNQYIKMSGRYRKPDGLTSKRVWEVKNVGTQGWTSQLNAYAKFAKSSGRTFHLVVRRNTHLTRGVKRAIARGDVIVHRIL